MHVDNAAQLVSALVPGRNVRSALFHESARSRSGQINSYHLEYVGVRYVRIVEAWSIDESDQPSFELEASTGLDVGCTRLQSSANSQVGAANEIDKLKSMT